MTAIWQGAVHARLGGNQGVVGLLDGALGGVHLSLLGAHVHAARAHALQLALQLRQPTPVPYIWRWEDAPHE